MSFASRITYAVVPMVALALGILWCKGVLFTGSIVFWLSYAHLYTQHVPPPIYKQYVCEVWKEIWARIYLNKEILLKDRITTPSNKSLNTALTLPGAIF